MNTDINFLEAAKRHKDSADLLYAQQHWQDADHLYGLAAECGLKALMIELNPQISNANGDLEKQHKVHIDKLWNQYNNSFVSNRNAQSLSVNNPFSDWKIEQRYFKNSADPHFQKIVDTHKQGTSEIFYHLQTQGLKI